MTEEERIDEVETQATASLLCAVDIPETILRLLLRETEIERTFEPPEGYDPEQQGEWDESLITYKFKRPIEFIKEEREPDYLYAEFNFKDLGYWSVEIEPERVTIERL